MLTLYGDESYSHPPAPLVYTIAGYISETYRWEKFEREWAKVLEKENIEFFHMKDFAQKKGVYETWEDKTGSHRLPDLVSLMCLQSLAA